MSAVFYSLLPDPHGIHERQWIRSVESLRRHNAEIPVTVVLYGAIRAETLRSAERAGAEIVQMGAYGAAFGELPCHWRQALAANPSLHKLISLRRLCASHDGRLLYLDCDTYFGGDVEGLLERHVGCQWFAREEPGSSRSHYGYDPGYVDETALAEIAQAEGLVPIPPYNTGVFVVGPDLAVALAGLVDEYLWYAWRLLLGQCLWRPWLVHDPSLAAFVLGNARAPELRLALPYPSGNGWILEQVATWMVLGRIPGITHGLLLRSDVIQGREHVQQRAYTVAHYYTVGEQAFVAELSA